MLATATPVSDATTVLRAVQIFSLEEACPHSPIAENVWRTESEPIARFTSVAVLNWKLVVTRYRGRTMVTLRGPETRASVVPVPQDAEFFGIDFRLGTGMPELPFDRLVDGDLTLPLAGVRSFWLNGSAWEIPTFGNADVFLDRLRRRGRVVHDPLVEAALRERDMGVSLRTIRRRVRQSTGLTLGLIRQIERAHRAARLLDRGAAILDVVARTGYADQAHLTRSVRRFIGHTPAQIVRDYASARSTS
jgi:AraC-like DNA-binding protein